MAPDKLLHLKAGVAIALFSFVACVIAALAGIAPVEAAPLAIGLAGVVGGLVKEGADWLDNKTNPGMHGVELLDALATAAPCILLAVAVHTWGLPL